MTQPKRPIAPHKGGRATPGKGIKKSTDVSIATNTKLTYIKNEFGLSLADLIEWAVTEFIAQQGRK